MFSNMPTILNPQAGLRIFVNGVYECYLSGRALYNGVDEELKADLKEAGFNTWSRETGDGRLLIVASLDDTLIGTEAVIHALVNGMADQDLIKTRAIDHLYMTGASARECIAAAVNEVL